MSVAAECQRWLRRKQYTFEVTFALNMFRSWEKSVICTCAVPCLRSCA